MTPAFVLLLFLSVTDASQRAVADDKDQSDELNYDSFQELSLFFDDILGLRPSSRNIDLCIDGDCKWPKSGQYVIVPYYISPNYTQEERSIILIGLESFHQSTCIRFVPKGSDHQDYIYFVSKHKSGCASYVGRQTGRQKIFLEKNKCMSHAIVQHEVLHALGFNHEHARSDRDQHVRILFKNIQPEKKFNFLKESTSNLETPYDFNSVMHYGKYDFSKNGKPTIVARSKSNRDFRSADQMSINDIIRVNNFYRCS